VTDYRIQAAIDRDNKVSGTWRASINGKEDGGSVTGAVTTPALPAAGFAAPVPIKAFATFSRTASSR